MIALPCRRFVRIPSATRRYVASRPATASAWGCVPQASATHLGPLVPSTPLSLPMQYPKIGIDFREYSGGSVDCVQRGGVVSLYGSSYGAPVSA